jgi:hypothetical protein
MPHEEAEIPIIIPGVTSHYSVRVISMMHIFRGIKIIDSVAGGATPLLMNARIRKLKTFVVQIIVAGIPGRPPATAAIRNIRRGAQIVVVFSRKDIVSFRVITAQAFLDPPEIAAGQVAGRSTGSCVEHNGNRD